MNREIELKFRLKGPDRLRRRLRELSARCVGQRFEVNRLFDTPQRGLARRGCALRVRVIRSASSDQPTGVLTYKGPREAGPVKVRTELETAVAEPETMAAILSSLGLREMIRYDKTRETWQMDALEVVIDQLPRLGFFGEIEGPSVQQVQLARTALEIGDADLVSESYVALTAKHGQPGPEGMRVLAFAASELDRVAD